VRRLSEQHDAADPNEALGAALLAKVARLEPSPMRKRRVWVALHRRPVRRPLVRRSGAVAVGLVLCGATAASATMTRIWANWQRSSAVVAETPARAPAPPSPVVRAPAPPATPQVESVPVAPKIAPKTRATDPVEQSAALMVQAMRARRAGSFARVRELSSEYRLKYPNGGLHEEALALSIEAAVALGDADASRLAALYLQRYPSGRFRGQAQRALGSSR
jgi:hypothetical protein